MRARVGCMCCVCVCERERERESHTLPVCEAKPSGIPILGSSGHILF
jgi:hypothetical protein